MRTWRSQKDIIDKNIPLLLVTDWMWFCPYYLSKHVVEASLSDEIGFGYNQHGHVKINWASLQLISLVLSFAFLNSPLKTEPRTSINNKLITNDYIML